MAKRQVVFSICDRCHIEVQTEFKPQTGRLDTFVLPDGWIHISANSRTATVFEMDLCDVCKATVLTAAGAARRD